MNRKSVLEKLFYSEMAEHCESTESDESDICYEKLFDEIRKYIPGGYETEVHISYLIEAYVSSKAEVAFKRGVSFATAFMSEALQPKPKSRNELNKEFEKI